MSGEAGGRPAPRTSADTGVSPTTAAQRRIAPEFMTTCGGANSATEGNAATDDPSPDGRHYRAGLVAADACANDGHRDPERMGTPGRGSPHGRPTSRPFGVTSDAVPATQL